MATKSPGDKPTNGYDYASSFPPTCSNLYTSPANPTVRFPTTDARKMNRQGHNGGFISMSIGSWKSYYGSPIREKQRKLPSSSSGHTGVLRDHLAKKGWHTSQPRFWVQSPNTRKVWGIKEVTSPLVTTMGPARVTVGPLSSTEGPSRPTLSSMVMFCTLTTNTSANTSLVEPYLHPARPRGSQRSRTRPGTRR